MAKQLVPKHAKVSTEFLENLDADVTAHSDVLSEGVRSKIVDDLKDYTPKAQKYIKSLDRDKREDAFLKWMLTMRVTELKVAEAVKCLETIFDVLENRNYSKSTKEAAIEGLKTLRSWLEVL